MIVLFAATYQAAIQLLVMQGMPWPQAVISAYRMACDGVEYLRRQGVNVETGGHYIEGGAPQAPQPQAPPQPQQQPQVQLRPVPLTLATTPGPSTSAQTAPTIVDTTAAAVPNVQVLPPPPDTDLVAFIQANLRPGAWVAEENLGAANDFVKQLEQRFGIGLNG